MELLDNYQFRGGIVFCTLIVCLIISQHVSAQDSIVHDPNEYLSHTLPVLYINTEGNLPVVSKEEYLSATYYLDANGFDQYESIGSAEAPLALEIKGRGNASWNKPKKPYRLKLEKKAAMLGMPKSKHWCLMAAYADWRGKGRDYMAFQISRLMGMPWTPGNVPCELVLNGDYMGLYFIVEHIRIAKERVNIFDQEEVTPNDSVPMDVTGGWLLEIDNYNEENQVRLMDIDGSPLRITYHSPEDLSTEQDIYIRDLLNKTNNAINTTYKGSREWEDLIDIDALARFYMINEVVDNQEAFSGSCYFYKDKGDSAKFIFGPVWDFGSSMGSRLNGEVHNFSYEPDVTYVHNHWIPEIAKFPRFKIALRKYWHKYRDEVFPQMEQVAIDYGNLIAQAGEADYRRWGDGSSLGVKKTLKNYVNVCLENKRLFLASQWDQDYTYPLGDINLDGTVDVTDVNLMINLILGKEVKLWPEANPDLNDSGTVDVTDVNAVINALLGK